MNPENLRAEFERYQREHNGEPIDSAISEEAKRELLLDKMHDNAKQNREPDRKAVIASFPQGALHKVEIPEENIPAAIEALTWARKLLTDAMAWSDEAEFKIFKDPRNTTLKMLQQEIETGAVKEKRIVDAVASIRSYMTIDPETTLYDLPELIKEYLFDLKYQPHSGGKLDSGENDIHGNYDVE